MGDVSLGGSGRPKSFLATFLLGSSGVSGGVTRGVTGATDNKVVGNWIFLKNIF